MYYRIDLNDAMRLIYLCIVYTFSNILIFGYLSDYIRCASNVLKCLGRYPNNN